jgi:hypothetical protein
MPSQSYRNPALVEVVIRVLARWYGGPVKARAMLLAEGFEIDKLTRLLNYSYLDPQAYMLAILTSSDFVIVPRINGPVRAVRLRLQPSHPDTDLQDIVGVDLFTDSGIKRGTRRLLRVLPPLSDLESAGAPQHLEEIESAATRRARQKKEDEIAIELATQELRQNPKLKKKADLFERLFGPEDKRTPLLKGKTWATPWTLSRLKRKVWKPALEGAGRYLLSRPGRRPDE